MRRKMKCTKCGALAVINMRQHRLRLCAEHFASWFVQYTERTIEKYHMLEAGDHVLVAVSGGKDSLALWDVLPQLGYETDGLYIDLGIEGSDSYSRESRIKAQKFADSRGLSLHVVSVKDVYGESVSQVANRSRRGQGKPCSVCGLIKRHVMNRVGRDGGYAALATGHNLDDEAAVLMQNTLRWQTGYLARQSPVLEAADPGLVRKVKPLCRHYERESAAYSLVRGIDYIQDECPYAVGATTIRYKEHLNRLEGNSPGTKHSFYTSFLRAKKAGSIVVEDARDALHPCDMCGQPTTAPGQCAFCRLWAASEPK